MCLRGCDLFGIVEMWWDGSYGWSAGMEGYRFFRKDRQGDGETMSPSMSVTSWGAQSSAWEWVRS